jgi:ABC-2 type transport system permease protein
MEMVRIYGKLIKISMLGKLQYRADFLTGIFSILVLNGINLSAIGILVERFTGLSGWSLWEMVFLYCLWILGHSIYSLFFWHFFTMEELVVQGRFDMFLVRPLPVLLQFLAQGIQYMGVGDILVGITGISLAYANLDLHWTPLQWLLFLTAIAAGAAIETGVNWIIASVGFWTVRTFPLTRIATGFMMMVQQYPTSIFGRWFRIVVTGILPFAFMNYYPALLLLGKQDPGTAPWFGYLSPAVALGLLLLGLVVWNEGLKRYASTGN